MLKWILGCLGLIVVAVICLFWFGYRQLKTSAERGPASVIIQAPASRVFASVAHADSLATWRAEGPAITPARRGPLQIGDTLIVDISSARRSRLIWIVSGVAPDVVLAMDVRDDSTGRVMFARRDSLISFGDSTRVLSVFTAPMLDSLKARGDTTRGSGMLGIASSMMTGGMRLQAEFELKRLKTRIEGIQADSTRGTPP